MEAFAALGLASNIVQFVQFAFNLVHTAVEIHKSSSGSTSAVLTLDSLYEQLNRLNDQLLLSHGHAEKYLQEKGNKKLAKEEISSLIKQTGQLVIDSETSVHHLWLLCRNDCDKLLRIVRKLQRQDGTKGRWTSFRAALEVMWKKEEIESLENRLQRTQMTIVLHACNIASHMQEDRHRVLEEQLSESRRLQLDQCSKLEQINTAIQCLDKQIKGLRNHSTTNTNSHAEMELLEQGISNLSISQDAIEEEQNILKSLAFEARPVRHSAISKAHCETFDWVYQPGQGLPLSATYIAEWLTNDEDIFWVSGKAGSGKSTFMKYVADDVRTHQLLSKWSDRSRLVIAAHYFWAAGTAMQKSEQGLLRSLLYEILRQCSDLIVPVCGDRRATTSAKHSDDGQDDYRGDLLPWTLTDLYTAIRKVAIQNDSSTHFSFFIDGLDEYDGDHTELCQVLKDLAKSSNIKMCLSSRPWNVFEEALGSNSRNKLYIQHLTRNDILKYIRCQLYQHPRWPSLNAHSSQGDWLVKEIETRASGVFLWVFLVTKLLRDGLTNRDTFLDIRRRLESFPVELGDFFRQMLESVKPFYHEKMSIALQVAVAAEEPLHAMAYDFLDQEIEDEDYLFGVPIELYSDEEDAEIKDLCAWRLDSRSSGLLELHIESGTVSFLHRTVMEYLSTPEQSAYLASKAPPNYNLNFSLLRMYTAIIKRAEFDIPSERKTFGVYGDHNLANLIKRALHCVEAMTEGERSGISLFRILDELDRVMSDQFVNCQAGFLKDWPAELFIREQLVNCQLHDFFAWKLPQDRGYLTSLGSSVICRALSPVPKESGFGLHSSEPWYKQGIDTLRCILQTQHLEVNDPVYHHGKWWCSGWASLILYATSWRQGMGQIEEEHFWMLLKNDIFSLLLRKGANPNELLWSNTITIWTRDTWTAFDAYLNLALEIPPNPELEGLYLQVLAGFMEAGAVINTSIVSILEVPESDEFGQPLVEIPRRGLLGRLRNLYYAQLPACNSRLLHQVANAIYSKTSPESTNRKAAAELLECVEQVSSLEKAAEDSRLQSSETARPEKKRAATARLETLPAKVGRYSSSIRNSYSEDMGRRSVV